MRELVCRRSDQACCSAADQLHVDARRDRLDPRRQRPGQDDACCARWPACRARQPATLAWARRAGARAAAALPRPRQRPEGRPDRRASRCASCSISHGGRVERPTSTPRSRASAWPAGSARLRCARCRRASAAASPWRAWRRERELQPWLLDEPFDALDAAGVERPRRADRRARAARGGSVVLTSHLPLPIADPAPVIVQLHAALLLHGQHVRRARRARPARWRRAAASTRRCRSPSSPSR